jgi:hypothetical protein
LLIYIEFISRRPGVGLHEFHRVAGHGQSGWAGEYDDDLCVLNVGRSWRIGPEPEYMCVWYSARQGLDRIDDWETVFRSGDADHLEEPFRLAARIDRAGCYEPLLEPAAGSKGRYYAEWIDFSPAATRHDVSDYYEQRRAAHPELELNLLCDRIGKLGPEPRALAVWGLPSWAAADTICRELDAGDGPVRLVAASFYADWGEEQL